MTDKPINVFQTMILLALNNPKLGKGIYGGTVPAHVIERRRTRGRIQRESRRRNRVG